MSLGSINSSTVPAAAYDTTKLAGDRAARAQSTAERSIADHVAAADEHEPIRHVSTTQGTLVDTYL
jgi:hypothetical protein